MKRFKKILYVIESTSTLPGIAEKVQTLARTNNAHVHIALLQEQLPSLFVSTDNYLKRMEDLKQFFKNEHEKFLKTLLMDESWNDIEHTGSVVTGVGFVEIITMVLKDKFDLIIIEEPTLTRIKIGQLAVKLLRKCPCPVWIMRSKPKLKIKNILAAIDFQEDSEHFQLNSQIIQMASSLANRERGTVHYLHAYLFDFESALSLSGFTITPEELEGMKREGLKSRRHLMHTTFEKANVPIEENQVIFREGDPAEVIGKTIEEYSIDTLVLGSVARSDIPGLLMTNHAEKIVTEIDCSVLAVKPDNFISPVTLQ